MIYLSAPELLAVAERVVGAVVVRDIGLLEAAAARPQATFGGEDVYPTIETKAAALLHSLARNHPLIDGNKRLALAGTVVFLGVNGWRLQWSNDEAYDYVMAVASSEVDDVDTIESWLRRAIVPRAG